MTSMTDTAPPSPPAGTPPWVPTQLELLTGANQRLVRTVDALTANDLARPSLLPGWSRAHVVAHLALNGESLERVLSAAARGEQQTMYDSPEAREADIEELARAEAGELRERLLASTNCFDRGASAVTGDAWRSRFERTPRGGATFSVATVPLMRLREVEIHHADLGTDYTAADWPVEFDAVLIESMTRRPYPRPFRVLARDLARTWDFGEGDPVANVTGDAASLGWWLTGRGDGADLTVDQDRLPEVPSW
jgi:maleylpyruvate isomerase